MHVKRKLNVELKLSRGLADVMVAVEGGRVPTACVFRHEGLAIIAAKAEDAGPVLYSITHETSGLSLSPRYENPMHALSAVAALLTMTDVDWTATGEEVRARVAAGDKATMELIAAIRQNRIQFIDLNHPVGRA